MSVQIVGVAGLESAPLDDGIVLFDPASGNFLMLNGSATLLWEALVAPTTTDELAHKLCDTFVELNSDTASADTLELVQQLRGLGLVKVAGD